MSVRLARNRRSSSPERAFILAGIRSSNALRWLNVCHVDIDCYKVGLSVGDALGAIVNLQDAGILPAATMFARSGRGLWVFWYLVDEGNPVSGTRTLYNAEHGPSTPQRAHGRAIALYARVQWALADRLAHLGADIGALDGCRFAPVPGTLKTATEASWSRVLSIGCKERTGRGSPTRSAA